MKKKLVSTKIEVISVHTKGMSSTLMKFYSVYNAVVELSLSVVLIVEVVRLLSGA